MPGPFIAIGNLRYSSGHRIEPHLDRIQEDADIDARSHPARADRRWLSIARAFPDRTHTGSTRPNQRSSWRPSARRDYLILSTIHSAKGQEWKSVFVMNVGDGCMPSDLGAGASAELEEERRLLYVAMTRAKDDLHLVVPQRFFTRSAFARRPASSDAKSVKMRTGQAGPIVAPL